MRLRQIWLACFILNRSIRYCYIDANLREVCSEHFTFPSSVPSSSSGQNCSRVIRSSSCLLALASLSASEKSGNSKRALLSSSAKVRERENQ